MFPKFSIWSIDSVGQKYTTQVRFFLFFFFHLLTVENVFPVIFLLFVRLVTDGLMESYFGLQKIMPKS